MKNILKFTDNRYGATVGSTRYHRLGQLLLFRFKLPDGGVQSTHSDIIRGWAYLLHTPSLIFSWRAASAMVAVVYGCGRAPLKQLKYLGDSRKRVSM